MKKSIRSRWETAALVLLALASAAPAATQAFSLRTKQSARRATHDYGRLLHQDFGAFRGYYTCPAGQLYGHQIYCRAEFRQGATWLATSATADVRSRPTSFSKTLTVSWHRRWTGFSAAPLRGFSTPGTASVNTKYEDWAFLAAGAYYAWQHHKQSAIVDSYDGQGLGYGRFSNFRCRIGTTLVTCRNAFGDAIRYRPKG